MQLIPKRLTVMLLGLVLFHSPLQASEQRQRETSALLDFVEQSQCRFVRNGSEYPAAQARAHLEKKRDYLEGKKLLKRAEDFIELAASKSSMTGKAYEVRCPSGSQPSKQWLDAELQRIRQS